MSTKLPQTIGIKPFFMSINVTEFVDIVLRNAVSPIRIVFTYPHQLNRHVNKISETIGIKPFFMSTKVPRR